MLAAQLTIDDVSKTGPNSLSGWQSPAYLLLQARQVLLRLEGNKSPVFDRNNRKPDFIR